MNEPATKPEANSINRTENTGNLRGLAVTHACELLEQAKCVILTLCDGSLESLQQAAEDLSELLCRLNWNNAIADIRSPGASVTALQEMQVILTLMLRVPDETRLSILASTLDNEDAAYLIRRHLADKILFCGVFETRADAVNWLTEMDNVVSNNSL